MHRKHCLRRFQTGSDDMLSVTKFIGVSLFIPRDGFLCFITYPVLECVFEPDSVKPLLTAKMINVGQIPYASFFEHFRRTEQQSRTDRNLRQAFQDDIECVEPI